MADIQDLGNENIDNLRESIDYSRILIDNAKVLYDLNKRNSSELFRGFRDSAKILVKNLEDLESNYKKYLGYEASHKDVLKKIEGLELTRNDLIGKRIKLEEVALRDSQADIDRLFKKERILQNQLEKGAKVNSTLYEAKRKLHTESLKELKSAREGNELLYNTLDITKELIKDSSKQLEILKQQDAILIKNEGKITSIKKIYESLAKIPGIGGFINAERGIATFEKSLNLGKSTFSSAKESIGEAFAPLAKLSIAAIAIEGVIKLITTLVEIMFVVDKQITNISRKMATSKDNAAKLREEFIGINKNIIGLATIQEGVTTFTKDIYESWLNINDQLGTAVKLDGAFLAQISILKNQIGLSDEALKGLTFTSKVGEKSAENIVKNILGQNILLRAQGKSAIENLKLIESTLKISGQLRAIYKGNTEEIAKGVAQAHIMGTTLEKLNEIAKGFLNFETSISSEFEAQLLTGKNLNLDAARYYSLVGDTNNMMKEIQKNFPSWEEFSHMNRIAQEGYAKALNMSVDEMSNMVYEQQTLAKLSKANEVNLKGIVGAQAAGALIGIKSLKEIMPLLDKFNISAEARKQILSDEVYLNLQNQSAQDKFNNSMEKMKEIFANLVSGGTLDKFANLVVAITNSLSKGITGVFGIGKEYERLILEKASERVKNDVNFSKAFTGAQLHKTNTVIGLTGTYQKPLKDLDPEKVAEFMYSYDKNKKLDDFIIKDNKITPFRKDDVVMGGTNLMGSNEEMKKLNKNIEILIDTVRQGKDINMDSYQIGTLTALGTMGMQ